MSKPHAAKNSRARPKGLQHLEGLEPHIYGSDWRKKPEYTAWRLSWNGPLLGGRLPSPAYYALRLAELYRFFAPPVLFLLVVAIGVYIWKGWPVPAVLWLFVWPIGYEMPRYLRFLYEIGCSIVNGFIYAFQILAAIYLILSFFFVWLRIR